MRAAIYARVSTQKQDPENQIPRLKEFCKVMGWELAPKHIYQEHITGTGKEERKEFERLLAAARRREFDILLVWKFDRFTREGAYTAMKYIKMLDDYGVRFKSLTESFLDTTGDFGKEVLIPLMAWIARQESLKIGERIRAGIARKQKTKGWKGITIHTPPKVHIIRFLPIFLGRPPATYRDIAAALNVSTGYVHNILNSAPQNRHRLFFNNNCSQDLF